MNYDELEAKVIDTIDNKTQFAQDAEFALPNVIPKTDLIGLGIGGGISGLVSGAFNKFIPFDLGQFGIDGLVPIVAGTLIKLVIKPTNMLGDVTNGLIVAGISEAVSGFTGAKVEQVRVEPENTHIQSGVVY
jgi:hypothetical protein